MSENNDSEKVKSNIEPNIEPENVKEKQRISEKDVLAAQLALAEAMQLKADVRKFLETVPNLALREWYYICALDKMPLEKLQEMKKKNYTFLQVKKERQAFLQESWRDMDVVNNEIIRLKKEAEAVFKESRDIRDLIMNNVEEALKKQAMAQEETIRTKDEVIKAKDQIIEGLKEDLKKYSNFSKGERERNPIEHEVEVSVSPGKKEKKESVTGGIEKKTGFSFKRIYQKASTRKFLDTYIKNTEMSDEQKDFLLSCLENDMLPEDVASFASPALSVSMMERLYKMKKKELEKKGE